METLQSTAAPPSTNPDHASIHNLAEAASSLIHVSQSPNPIVARALTDGEKPAKRGSNLACLKCRAIKVRCSRAAPEDEKCKRCTRLNLECEFREHHRGRKPKKRIKTQDDHHQLAHGSPEDSPSPHKSHSRTKSAIHASQSPDDQHEVDELEERVPSPRNSVQGHYIGPYLQSILNPDTTIAGASSSSRSRQNAYQGSHELPTDNRNPKLSTPPTTERSHLRDSLPSWAPTNSTLPEANKPSHHPQIAASVYDDAIKLGVISVYEGEELVRYFMDELNPPLALLDRYLHTFDYLRSKCPLLFSTVISTSSRFFRPDLHTRCLQVQRSVMALAAVEELCSLDHIQALIAAVTWKDPSDRTVDRKVNRAVGYAYELGLHASFADDIRPNVNQASNATRASNGTDISKLQRRIKRDRQRTWIMLCLVQAVMRRDDGTSRPRPRVIPLHDHPDAVSWYHQGGDITLTIDSRVAWSLESICLAIEMDDLIQLCATMPNPTGFGPFFEQFHRRSAVIRRRWFTHTDGQYVPRFPMDRSAVAELPYLDTHRNFGMAEATWQWAYKVSTFGETESGPNQIGSISQARLWFTRAADNALRNLQLFLDNIVKPGYLRVGHDYLVICASYAAKWLFLYRHAIDPITLITAHDVLIEIIRECSQPQRLPTGEITSVEREAPGYLVRYVEALLNAGLSEAVENAKSRQRGRSASEKGIKVQGLSPGRGGYVPGGESKGSDRRSPYYPPLTSYRSDRGAASHYRESPVSRYPIASQRTDVDAGRPFSIELSFERGHAQLSQVKESASPPSPSSASSMQHAATHPAYLNGSAPALPPPSSSQHSPFPSNSWQGHSATSNLLQQPVHQPGQAPFFSGQGPNMGGMMPGIDPSTASAFDMNVASLSDVAPIGADMSKASLDNLVSNLGAQDLSYWEGMLGQDLSALG